jgi:hypothetical protein
VETTTDTPATGIPPALAAVVAAARAAESAERDLVQALTAAKRPAGPHTAEQVLAALDAAGIRISRATLYAWLGGRPRRR